MISGSSALALDHSLIAPSIEQDPTSAFDPDRVFSPSNPRLDFSRSYVTTHRQGAPLDNFLDLIVPDKPSNAQTDYLISPTHGRVGHHYEYSDALTYSLIKLIDLKSLLEAEISNNNKRLHQIRRAYQIRIETLRGYAISEGFTVKKVSEEDFWIFFRSTYYTRKAALFLMDNGDLRAVWKDDNGNRIGLQFFGNQLVEYVIFRHRSATKNISRVAGRDTLDGVKKQIHSFDLVTMMNI